MPTYAYACTQCGHQFDVVQSFSDDSLTTCPECSGALRKQYNAVGVVFKGGGFYRNDSRAADSSSSSASSSTPAGTGDSATSSGSSSASDSSSTSTSSSTSSSATSSSSTSS
ncbi:MAG TPA: FmdB family transcriptional regulator [Candidatus Janibacter merdipullorum]|nr:FmdB family transcriptional regulator [Candidatus Janibacter merdipullorum]